MLAESPWYVLLNDVRDVANGLHSRQRPDNPVLLAQILLLQIRVNDLLEHDRKWMESLYIDVKNGGSHSMRDFLSQLTVTLSTLLSDENWPSQRIQPISPNFSAHHLPDIIHLPSSIKSKLSIEVLQILFIWKTLEDTITDTEDRSEVVVGLVSAYTFLKETYLRLLTDFTHDSEIYAQARWYFNASRKQFISIEKIIPQIMDTWKSDSAKMLSRLLYCWWLYMLTHFPVK